MGQPEQYKVIQVGEGTETEQDQFSWKNPISVVIKLCISHYGINIDVGEQQNFIGYHGMYSSFCLYTIKVHI